MAGISHVDELVDYNQLIVNRILSSQKVMALIANDPNLDLDSDAAAEWEEHIIDHAWIDDTVQEAGAFVTVDVDVSNLESGVIKEMRVYVEVLVSKAYMKLSPSLFKGCKGNRRDNIVRQVDKLINGSYDFGIGKLDLVNIRTVTTANKFAGKLLTYEVYDFARDRKLAGYGR